MKILAVIIGVVFIVFISVLVVNDFQSEKACDEEQGKIEEVMDYLNSNDNPIESIGFTSGRQAYAKSINKNEIIIDDPYVLQNIKNTMINKSVESWNRPTSEWELLMTLNFENKKILTVLVSKLSNSRVKGRTHIYFQFYRRYEEPEKCLDVIPSYSDELGIYLEQILAGKGLIEGEREYYK